MASTWTKAQSVEISDIKSAIRANAEAIKENREAIMALDKKFESKLDQIIDILARNGIK